MGVGKDINAYDGREEPVCSSVSKPMSLLCDRPARTSVIVVTHPFYTGTKSLRAEDTLISKCSFYLTFIK